MIAAAIAGANREASVEEGEMLKAILGSDKCPLPDNMVPWKVFVMDSFPLTHNGKIDRRSLITMADELYGSEGVVDRMSSECVPPQTTAESELCALWQSLLGVERVGINDNFFELGGDSLLAMRLAQELSCEVRLILGFPTVSELLEQQHIWDAKEGDDSIVTSFQQKVDAMVDGLKELDVMTQAEKRMLFIHLQNPDSNAYNIPFRVKFDEDVDLRLKLQEVVNDTPLLRTRFVSGKAVVDIPMSLIILPISEASKE
eukprot:14543622-Ditylum_brightwellii.AAC.1